MDKELKIVVSIFLLFFIYGLGSVYYSGSFVTFYFLNQLVLLVVAILFIIMNWKTPAKFLLLLYAFAQLLLCLIDGFTIGFLASKYQMEFLIPIHESNVLSIVFLIYYFGFFLFLSIYSLRVHQLRVIVLSQAALIASTIIFFYVPDLTWIRDLSFALFVLLFVLGNHRFMKQNSHVLQVVSYQLILLVLLEGFEYFQ